jgi:phosphatidylserine/phosphatidylglycerophosphate/cardiolipin synthase-like enzyme
MRSVTLAAVMVMAVLVGCASTPAPMVCFSPGGHCADDVIREVGTAHKTIYVQAYGFTHPGIAKALADAEARGVDVEAILDKSNLSGQYSEAGVIARAGVKTFIDSRHPIAHDKVIVIDQVEVITGSFNFTRAADEKNAENLLIVRSKPLAAQYIADWETHRSHSTPFITSDSGD